MNFRFSRHTPNIPPPIPLPQIGEAKPPAGKPEGRDYSA
jgi:hypothetical protein